MIAHRGLAGIERENTLLSFVAAANRSYFGLECDVHVTADGQYLVFHDDRTGRICERDLSIEGSTTSQLRALKMKDAQTEAYTDAFRIPTLSEYLAVCARYEKTAVIELKNEMRPADIAAILSLCRKEYDLGKAVFISFCFENLVQVRKLLPAQAVQYLCGEYSPELLEKLRAHAFDIDIWHGALTAENIAALHGAGIAVNCWTCDEKERAEELIAWGADYITSNILE